jgi:hypothetical protein
VLGEMEREEQGLEGITGVKSSAEKQRRQIPAVPMASGTDPDPHSIPTETDTAPQVDNNHQCTHFFETKHCRLDNCRRGGGRCIFVICGGIEICQHGRLLANGAIVEAARRVSGCGRCGCSMYPDPKKFDNSDCLITASFANSCHLAQAQRCYNAGARCNAIQIIDEISKCTEAHVQGAEPSGVWHSQACRGCECARQWSIPNRGPIAGTGRRGWSNIRLSVHASHAGAEPNLPSLPILRSPTRPGLRGSNPNSASSDGASILVGLTSLAGAETNADSSTRSGLRGAIGQKRTPNSRSSDRSSKQRNPSKSPGPDDLLSEDLAWPIYIRNHHARVEKECKKPDCSRKREKRLQDIGHFAHNLHRWLHQPGLQQADKDETHCISK